MQLSASGERVKDSARGQDRACVRARAWGRLAAGQAALPTGEFRVLTDSEGIGGRAIWSGVCRGLGGIAFRSSESSRRPLGEGSLSGSSQRELTRRRHEMGEVERGRSGERGGGWRAGRADGQRRSPNEGAATGGDGLPNEGGGAGEPIHASARPDSARVEMGAGAAVRGSRLTGRRRLIRQRLPRFSELCCG
jgi:hypothetical protein